MTHINTLNSVTRAARNQNLHPTTSMNGDVVFDCPTCTNGTRAYAALEHGRVITWCAGCEPYDEHPLTILALLGHEEDHGDEHEVVLRFFDLLWAIHKNPTP